MSYETYHIPVNFTDAGKLFGVFEIRNAVETVLLCIPILFLCPRQHTSVLRRICCREEEVLFFLWDGDRNG